MKISKLSILQNYRPLSLKHKIQTSALFLNPYSEFEDYMINGETEEHCWTCSFVLDHQNQQVLEDEEQQQMPSHFAPWM
jgi:hypothetical protein